MRGYLRSVCLVVGVILIADGVAMAFGRPWSLVLVCVGSGLLAIYDGMSNQ